MQPKSPAYYAGIAWPASSPYLTAVGGTRLVPDSANTRADEVVSNDLAWLSADNGGGAGGGGLSSASARPPWQSGLTIPDSRRAAPDVAAHASTLPFFDIVSGSNGYNPRVPGISATPGYDMASGLGVPRFDQLAATLPPPAP